MKSDVSPSIVQMEENVFNQLVSEVKETVASGHDFPKTTGSSFGILNLWNIRKHRKSAGSGFRGITIPNGMRS